VDKTTLEYDQIKGRIDENHKRLAEHKYGMPTKSDTTSYKNQ